MKKEKKEVIKPVEVEKPKVKKEEDLPVWNFPLQQRSIKAKTLEEALKKLEEK
mgnify:FL=1